MEESRFSSSHSKVNLYPHNQSLDKDQGTKKKRKKVKFKVTEISPKQKRGEKSTKIERENLNILKRLEEKEGFKDADFDKIQDVNVQIKTNSKGAQVWSTYKSAVTEYDLEGKPYEVDRLFLKTDVTWTVQQEDGSKISHIQTVYTNVRLPEASDGLDAANDAKRRARLLVGAYNNAFKAPIDPKDDQYAATKAKLHEIANETWLNVQVPQEGSNLSEYKVKVYGREGEMKKEGMLPSYTISKNVNYVARPRFSKTNDDLPDYVSEADQGVILIKGKKSAYRFEDEVQYQKIDQCSSKRWLRRVNELKEKGSNEEEKYFDHMEKEIEKLEEKVQEIKLSVLGSSGRIQQVGEKLPVIGKYFEGGVPLLRKYFGQSAAVKVKEKRKQLDKVQNKIKGASIFELPFYNKEKDRLEKEIDSMEMKIQADKKAMDTVSSDLEAVRNKLQFYINEEILKKEGKEEISNKELRILLGGGSLRSTQKASVEQYVKVSGLLEGEQRAIRLTEKDAVRVEKKKQEREQMTREKELESSMWDEEKELDFNYFDYQENIKD